MQPHLDEVIEACHKDPDFRWTIESAWQLKTWLDRTHDPVLVKQMGDLLRKGQIELSAADGSMHTEFMASEELNRLDYLATDIEHRLGFTTDVAVMNDVPGFTLRLPQVLAHSGVKFVITGSNTAFGGGTSLTPGSMPIDWKGPDGSHVFLWQTQGKNGGYTEAIADYFIDPDAEDPYFHTKFYPKEWSGLPKLEIMQRGIDKLIHQYQAAGYKHSAIAVLYMHDGVGPGYELNGLLPNIRAWNAAGRTPQLVVATPSEFFSYLLAHSNGAYPTYEGDWSGLWAAVKLNSPAMSADARWLQERLPQTETLWSLLLAEKQASDYPAKQIAADYWKLFKYDEHNGAGQGGWPKVMTREQVEEQNGEYSEDLRSARSSTNEMLQTGIPLLVAGKTHSAPSDSQRYVAVYNPLSWQTTQLVDLPSSASDVVVHDAASGRRVPAQRLDSGTIRFLASNLPPFGYRIFSLSAGHTPSGQQLQSSKLESPYYSVQISPATGTIAKVVDKRSGRVITAERDSGAWGALQLLGEKNRQTIEYKKVIIRHLRGPIADEITIERPDSWWPRTVISLPQALPRVDIAETLDRSKMRFVPQQQSSDHYVFDFAFSLHGTPRHWIDDGSGVYQFPENLLPGARHDAVVPRHFIGLSETGGAHPLSILLAQKQAFFDSFTGANSTDVRVDALFKSDQAETKDQGVVTFATFEPGYPSTSDFYFSITSQSGSFDPVATHHFGMESTFSPIAVLLPSSAQPAQWAQSMLMVTSPDVVVLALKPSRDDIAGHYMLRLREIAGNAAKTSLISPLQITSIDETDMTEEHTLRGNIDPQQLSLLPYQTMTLHLDLSGKNK
jgi:hypothetical protein